MGLTLLIFGLLSDTFLAALVDFNVYIPIKEIKEFGIEVMERIE